MVIFGLNVTVWLAPNWVPLRRNVIVPPEPDALLSKRTATRSSAVLDIPPSSLSSVTLVPSRSSTTLILPVCQ